MRYLFINSVAGFGSTGRIVVEQCRLLQSQGHECLIAYSREARNCDGIATYRIGSQLDMYLHAMQSRILDNSGFASRIATKKLVEKIQAFSPDVIWLHNLHGYYLDLKTLFAYLRTSGVTIYWTLHDCWSFTGHCPYFDYVGCERWKTGCFHCPQKKLYPASFLLDNSRKNYKIKRELLSGIPDMHLFVPSQWLKQRVMQSFLREYPVTVVPNTVDLAVFHHTESGFRDKYGLQDKRIVLGVANVWEPRKGLAEFCKLADILPEEYKIVLVGLSDKQRQMIPSAILGLGRTKSVEELVEIYSAADVYVCPSVEETFGMTVLEASACKTPVIVYKGTACEEVAAQFGGISVEPGAQNIAEAIIGF